jgi:hypothetical protein
MPKTHKFNSPLNIKARNLLRYRELGTSGSDANILKEVTQHAEHVNTVTDTHPIAINKYIYRYIYKTRKTTKKIYQQNFQRKSNLQVMVHILSSQNGEI